MGDFGMEATNEIGFGYCEVTVSVRSLPAATDRNGGAIRPRHAMISGEGGDVRYRLNGEDVVEPFGVLAKDGTSIDWTDPLRDFSAFIDNMSVIATNGATSVLLNISWRT